MSEYTKGRLEYSSAGHGLAGKGLVIDEYFIRRPEDDVALAADVVCPETGKPSEANARRLVACWNACEGIPTDVLEKGRISSDAFQLEESRADAAEQRCDELLTDLVVAAATLRRYETLHRAKGTDESAAKAEVNAALASRFEATIAKATQPLNPA